MERYFDAHLYLANWGTHQLMLRLPKHVLDPATVAQYCQGDSAFAWTAGEHVIIDLHDEDEDGTDEWDLDGHGPLTSIIPVRAGLAAGDLRLLYLAWLRCVQSEEIADDEPEPPVPAGLYTLDAALTAVAEFLRIDPDLIAAAAAGSTPATSGEPTAAQLRTWVVGLPVRDKDTILTDLITGGDSHLRSRLLRRYREAHRTDTPAPTALRTAGELLSTAAELHAERERRDAEQSERDGDSSSFRHRLAELRAVHAHKPSLLERLNLAGLDT
ncbi:hypothetical protein [Plantactinospora sp. WMMB782]|uniref:hypothetical protein n=1 Tax=Plantactinospora sp. WMMB782 TaxID=3404121 RepID=UPI003B932B9C